MSCLFDGVSDADTGFGRPWMQNVSGGTISAWVTTRLLAGTQSIWGAYGGTGTTRAKMSVLGSGAPSLRANSLDSDATSSFNAGSTISVGQRYHLVGVFNFSSKSGGIYINGVLITVGTFTNMTAGNTSNTACQQSRMASNEIGTTNSWNGEIEDLRVYNRALSADEISTLYATMGRDGILDGLQARWPLNERPPDTVASNIVDLSVNNFGAVAEGNIIYQSSGVTVERMAQKLRRPVSGSW